MRLQMLTLVLSSLFSQPIPSLHVLTMEERSTFRQAVDQYQMFVVPHCTPDVVSAYVRARADRDRAFIQSLRGTSLNAEYEQAVAERVEQDKHTWYECTKPPAPPPAKLELSEPQSSGPPDGADQQRANLELEHFAAGDRQFAYMVHLRDRLIGQPGPK